MALLPARRGAALATAALSLAAGLTGVNPAAHAADTSSRCVTSVSSTAPYYGSAKCTGFAPAYKWRVVVTCQGPSGGPFQRYGPVVRTGGVSRQKCSDSPNVGIVRVRAQPVNL
jgi:hypothetical protein